MVLEVAAVIALLCAACEERAGNPFGFPFSHAPATVSEVESGGKAPGTTPLATTAPQPATGGDLDEGLAFKPKMIRRVDPDYPPLALRDGIQGRVVVRFQIAPDGVPFNATIDAATHPVFHGPSLTALQRSRFEPQPAGKPVYAGRWFRQPYAFQIDDGEMEPSTSAP